MRVLFIYSLDDVQSVRTPLRSWATIQFGISYISAVLKAEGHETQLLVLGSNQWEASAKPVRTCLEEFTPRLICFTATCSQYAFIERIAGLIRRQWPDKYLAIGGPHATLQPDAVMAGPFDALCLGEGEYPTAELCRQLEHQQVPSGIANLWIRSPQGTVERNEPREFIQDLDQLPFPDRDMWRSWMREQPEGELAVLLGRGCPYDCTYCSNHALRKVAPGRYVRMRSPGNILQEVAFLHRNVPHERIYLEVETIALNKAWTIELCSRLAAFNSTLPHAISYGCNFRISLQSIDGDLFAAFEKANFYKINIGLESGSERIRRDVLKRNYSNDDFLRAVALARQHGLKVYVFNMIGLPGESRRDHEETVFLNRRCQPEGHYTGIFYPYPGTELHTMCLQQGLLREPLDTRMERKQPALDLPGFSKRQIRSAYAWFNYRVYKGHKPLWKILMQVLLVRIRSHPTANLLFRRLVQLPGLRQLRAKLARG
ncbi:MAG: radical SAM protein [Planctomycetota bacterium]|nr:radical SAM protein [Planctomycetota bacterium]